MKFRIREKKSRVEKFKDRADRARALYFSLVVSLASIIMSCFCLLGTTYALFTSTANTDNNSLGTGFLSVSLHEVEVNSTNQTAGIKNEFNNSDAYTDGTAVSINTKLSKYVYVMNNSTIDAEYSLGFSIGSTETPTNEGEESSASVADFVDVSYRKIDLIGEVSINSEEYNSMRPNNYVYLGKLSELLIEFDEGGNEIANNKRKVRGVLTKIKTEDSDLKENSDIQYPFGQLYEIVFSLNTTSEVSGDLSELPINIVLNSTQRDLDIYQISVIAKGYAVDGLEGEPIIQDIACTNFIGAGDYYAGSYIDENIISIQIKNEITCDVTFEEENINEKKFKPVKYSINNGGFENFEIAESSDYSIIALNEINDDVVIEIKYQLIPQQGK